MNFIKTDQAPKAVGPYSQAVLVDKTLYVSGQIPFDPKTNTLISNEVKDQTKQCLDNILAILKAAGFEKTDIAKCQVFMTDLSKFGEMNQVYEAFFEDHKPARAAVEVRRLPKDVSVEIDAVAVKTT